MKKQVSKLREDIGSQGQNPTQNKYEAPVVLNSIHNDGMALELKIKEILRWKMEPIEQKNKLRDEKLMAVELSHNKADRAIQEASARLEENFRQ